MADHLSDEPLIMGLRLVFLLELVLSLLIWHLILSDDYYTGPVLMQTPSILQSIRQLS